MKSDYEIARDLWARCGSRTECRNLAKRHGGLSPLWEMMWEWAECGFFSMETSHKYAAALMCTTGLHPDLVIPAKVIRIRIPEGILKYEAKSRRLGYVEYTRAYLFFDETEPGYKDVPPHSITLTEGDLASMDDFATKDTRPRLTMVDFELREAILGGSIEKYWGEEKWRKVIGADEVDGDKRCLVLAMRLGLGLMHTMQHTVAFKERISSRDGTCRTNGSGPPDHRNYVVGRKLQYDARPQITAWVTGNRKHVPPSMQHVVRGHYKRQVIGHGREHRKVIWVEPYWRGPKDAPILVRPRNVVA